ncbi:hypothetical protein ACFX2A_015199 [Malus domestica]
MEPTGSNRWADGERRESVRKGVDGGTYREFIVDSKARGALQFPFNSRGKRKGGGEKRNKKWRRIVAVDDIQEKCFGSSGKMGSECKDKQKINNISCDQ